MPLVRGLQANDGDDDDGLGSLQTSGELESFFKAVLIFIGVGFVSAVSLSCVCRRLGHTTNDGAFTSTPLQVTVRALNTLLVLFLVVLPAFFVGMSTAFGCVVAAAEHWSPPVGTAYVLGNVLGLQEPLTNVNPESNVGMTLDIIVSVYASACTAAVMGVASKMYLMVGLKGLLPPSLGGFLRYLTLYVPLSILALSCVLGAIFSAIEGWAFLDGFFFMTGAMAELANPIVNVGPTTAPGCFFEVMCVCVELCIGGGVIATISDHPQMTRFIKWFGHFDEDLEIEKLKERAAQLEVKISERVALKKGLVQLAREDCNHVPGSGDLSSTTPAAAATIMFTVI